MNSEQFAFWLHGYFEIADPKSLNENEVNIIKDHLNLVFNKVTPDRPTDGSILGDKLSQGKFSSRNYLQTNPYDNTLMC